MLVFVTVALGWMVVGVLLAAQGVKSDAEAARLELNNVKAALQRGDLAAADAGVVTARRHLSSAQAHADRRQVRLTKGLPMLGSPVKDLDHLLAAAHAATSAAARGVRIYGEFSAPESTIFKDSRFDLAALRRAHDEAQQVLADVGRATGELRAVRGGLLAPGVADARDSGLRQVAALQDELRPLVNTLAVLPDAVGARAQRRYLVTVLNESELRLSGGAPLSLLLARFSNGRLRLESRGQTSDITQQNRTIRWPAVPGNVWHQYGKHERLVNSTFSPDWPTSGEELLRAYEAETGIRADGVIALDTVALAALLRETGPLTVRGYGRVTAENLVRVVLEDSYVRFPDPDVRHEINNELMDAMVGRLVKGGGLLAKARVMSEQNKGRHVQLYFRDTELGRIIREAGLAGELKQAANDVLNVYTTNFNASKVDVHQRRSVSQEVSLRPDGGASVVRTMRLDNATPPYRGPGRDPGNSYLTAVSLSLVVQYLPDSARLVSVTVDGQPQPVQQLQDHGMRVITFLSRLQRGQSSSIVVRYDVPRVAEQTPEGLRYLLTAATQPIARPAQVSVTVRAPDGYTPQGGAGWTVRGPVMTTTRPFTQDLDLQAVFLATSEAQDR